jgi:hypothetical protein
MEDWLKKEAISFRYRRSETTKEGWLDSSLMNYLFRPKWDGFEEMSVYQFNCEFELCLKSSLRKKKGDTDNDGENELEEDNRAEDAMYIVNWDFLIEHPGRNFACCKKMKKQKIPMLYYRDELPDLEDCDIGVPEEELSESAKQSREAYATTMLLLFYPFRDTHVFDDAPNKWDFFCKAVDGKTEMKMYFDANRIMQNIQNLHNSKKFVRPKDKLILETELTRLQKEFCNGVEEQQVASNNEQMEGEESDTNDDTDLIIEEYAYFRNELEQVDSNRICSAASKNFDPKHLSSKDNIDTCDVLKESDFVPEGLTDIDTSKTVLRSNAFTKENFIQVILDFDKPCTPAESDRNWTFDQINPSGQRQPQQIY